MFGSEVIDVVIGMIFVFLLLSLVCSAVNELIEAWLNKRSGYLEEGIKELLNDKGGTGLVKELYEHPLIAGLFRGKYGKNAYLPSYIPARNFALALMDIFTPKGEKSATEGATTASGTGNSVQALRTAVSTSPLLAGNEDAKKALLSLIDAAGDDAAKARQNIENWFNSSMDRVSGWYKRRAQTIILVLGLAVTIFINADAITISNSLSHDKALRDSLVASAEEYAKSNAQPAASPAASPAATPAPSPSAVPATEGFKEACKTSKNEAGLCSSACLNNLNLPECKLEASLGKIKNLGLPIGWDRNNPKLVPPMDDIGSWLLKIFGWLITVFAISLGAPFWFDLLNKFMVVRSTVKPHEKSPEDQSKD